MFSRMLSAVGAALILAASAPAFAHDYEAGDIAIKHPWSRATVPNAPVAGAYMTLDNEGSSDDRLIGGSSPMTGEIQIHEMSMDDGVMRMRQLPDGLAVPAGDEVVLAPGGYHIMMMDPKQRFEQGMTIPLTLQFEKAGKVDVELAVDAMGARHPGDDGQDMSEGDQGENGAAPMDHGSHQ